MHESSIYTSVKTNNFDSFSPFSVSGAPYILQFPATLRDGCSHYWAMSIDSSEVFDEVDGFEGQEFYSCKIFVDGEVLYNTYYSKDQYDYLKNNQEDLELKYFTIGRCSDGYPGYWHYAKSKVYCMRLYSKGLTEEEMLENYNVTRAYYSTISE